MVARIDRIEITADELYTLAKKQASVKHMISYFGVSSSTFYERIRNDLELQHAIKKGRTDGLNAALNVIDDKIAGGSMSAAIFRLRINGFDPDNPVHRRKEVDATAELNDAIRIPTLTPKQQLDDIQRRYHEGEITLAEANAESELAMKRAQIIEKDAIVKLTERLDKLEAKDA